MTFSLVGRCPDTGRLGAVVASSSPAVAARCAWARAGAGAVCTQNVTDPRLGPALLDRLAAGEPATSAIELVVASAPHAGHRQLTAIGTAGAGAAYSGEHTLGRHAAAIGEDCVAAGNLLHDEDVVPAMVAVFDAARGASLGDRLIAALQAGSAAGGEEGPVHSCGVLVVDRVPWPVVNLRVDWHASDPIGELDRLWVLWQPQADAYVQRALDPASAPRYGVPGDA